MDFFAAFNACEAAWWTAMAAVCWRQGRGQWKAASRTAAVIFLLFAMTDVIEIRTGAWWRPWWLAAMKGVCVIGLISCGAWAWRIHRRTT